MSRVKDLLRTVLAEAMKIRIENLKNSEKRIKIEVEAERVRGVLDDVYGNIQKVACIPGYRTGKAPRDLIELHHEKAANDETLNRLIWECYREAILQEKIDPVGYPVIEEVNFDKDKPLLFSVKVDVRPEFKLKSYKGIKVKEDSPEVTADDVDKALKNLQESMAQYNNIDNRPIQMGDYVVCNYECLSEGRLVDKNSQLWLYINDAIQPKELLATLLGAEVGLTKEVEITHPQDYAYKELAGKKTLYRITPEQIKQKVLPDNDDLVKGAGSKSLEELKQHLRERLLSLKKEESRQSLKKQIFDSLLKTHSFEIPRSVIDRQLQHLVDNTRLRLLYQGYKKEELDKEDEQLRNHLREKAKENVQVFFILEKIAQEENIAVDDQELEERIRLIAKNSKEDPSELKKRMQERNLIENLKEQIIQDKAMEFLLKEARRV